MIVIVGLLVLGVIVPDRLADNATQDSVRAAQQTVTQFKAIRGYYTKNVIQKVVKDGHLKPSISHASMANGVPLPATFIHDVSKLLEKEKTSLRLYSAYPFPNRAKRQLDDFQTEAWAHLNENPDEVFVKSETVAGHKYVRVAMADFMSAQGCVSCHNSHPDTPKADWKLGDVRGVLEVRTQIDEALAASRAAANELLLIMAAAAILIALLMYVLAQHIAGPIEALTESARAVAQDDVSGVPLYSGRSDEVGALAGAIDVFRENAISRAALEESRVQAEAEAAQAQERLQTERQAAEQVRQTQMREVAAELEATVGSVVQQLSASTHAMQALAVTMRSNSSHTTETVSAVLESASTSGELSQMVASASAQLTSSIHEITERVAETSQRTATAVRSLAGTDREVESLLNSAAKIGRIVDLISEIADQTNLLALNATIEAASAGEAGRGFAVVASEVKQLAGASARATTEIAESVAEIRCSARSVAEVMDAIRESVTDIDGFTQSVAAAVEEQGSATAEISRNTELAAAGAGEVSNLVSNVSDAAHESGAAADTIRDSVDQLSQQAQVLEDEVARFAQTVRAA